MLLPLSPKHCSYVPLGTQAACFSDAEVWRCGRVSGQRHTLTVASEGKFCVWIPVERVHWLFTFNVFLKVHGVLCLRWLFSGRTAGSQLKSHSHAGHVTDKRTRNPPPSSHVTDKRTRNPPPSSHVSCEKDPTKKWQHWLCPVETHSFKSSFF